MGSPTPDQVNRAATVTRWYLDRYHDTAEDVGVARMFTDPTRLGHFAVPLASLRAGEPDALFRALTATVMFQRRQDLQIMRVLRGISELDAAEITSATSLLGLADRCGCPHAPGLNELLAGCDLRKDHEGQGACSAAPSITCAPKRHAVLLKRYGHFGKVPTSLALMLRLHQVSDLRELRALAISSSSGPLEAAERLEAMLCRAWRVSDKIAAMYLSMLTNPDLCHGISPWAEGLDWTRWVVIDSNVDLFLAWLGYDGFGTYAARRVFIQQLAAGIDLSAMKPTMNAYNPRIVQQAGYLFMSETNRRALTQDCSRVDGACGRCQPLLRQGCRLAATG